ncbi:transcriptional antiterminator BglG [Paenibacillus sp. FSL R7-269]|uniref:PRD domain-containing protein n=1 Tax=Paenibacillus sp. FSL R7-269 TaxID=1226755 RepID=UPI0003E2A51F|nr:PRD domain-containing protein [Paenibacillus sp. FSL R7-269]ETT52029.1 transcriptional antiterminator BglG [Paenibacillus sp. FSL R7-269]
MARDTEQFQVLRVIGNNVVMVEGGKKGKEYVIIGKGIGFALKDTGVIDSDDPRIEKLFRLEDREEWSQYQILLEDIDPKVMKITDEIISDIAREFSGKLNDKIYLALPSHIQFTIFRLRSGMDIVNPFLEETRMTFPKEFEIASKAAEKISEGFEVQIPEDEVGFLTYHVYSAVSNVPVGQLVKASNIVSELMEMIRSERKIRFEQGSMNHVRLMVHLRFSIERILQGSIIDNPFVKHIKKEFKDEYKLAHRMGTFMQGKLSVDVPEEEICFLAMHLHRLFQTIEKNK